MQHYKPWIQFLRDGSAAQHRSPLQDQHIQTLLGKVRGCDKPVVPPANDDDVPLSF